MKKQYIVILIVLTAVLALAAFSMPIPVSAQGNPGAGCPAETEFYDTLHGGVYFEQQGYIEGKSMEKTFNNVPEGIKIARVYTGFWQGSPGKGGFFNMSIQNATGSYTTDRYKACDPCPQAYDCAQYQNKRCDALSDTVNWDHNEGLDLINMHDYIVGCGVQFVSFNATPYILPGTNTITVKTEPCSDCKRGGWDGRIYVIALLVVYENESMPEMTYWINEGALYLEKGSSCDGQDDHFNASKYFNGTHVSNPTGVRLWSLGWPHVINADTKLNGNNIGDPDFIESHANNSYEVLLRWEDIPTSYLEDTSNFLEYYDTNPVYERAFAEVLSVQGPSDKPDLIVTDINAYHNNSGCPAWFNLSNEIDVTVKNNGSADAGVSNVSLYIENVFFGKLPVSSLCAGANETVTFENWKPIGDDCLQPPCEFKWSYHDYNLTGVADCDNEVTESNETNNESTVFDPDKTRVCYNGYTADEPLENVAHGVLHGGLLFTTGDGTYGGLYSPGATKDTNYDITIPDGATVELAQLNVYYTWTSPDHACPEMEVRITNATGTYVVPLEKAYNDIKCTCPGAAWIKTWGNYVFDLTDYITGSGTYTVTVANVGSTGHSFCIAAPGIALVYEDENAPLIEYWVNKGADLLLCGRRSDGGYLAWWECINNATFQASTETRDVVNATLGVVSSWAGSSREPGMTNYLFFNDIKVGTGVYHGFDETHSKTIDSITMHIGGTNAQVGVNVTNVTALYLKGSSNVVSQVDDGDNMMPANAFLVVEYDEEEEETDLIVSTIEPNCDGFLFGNESNELCAAIENIGGVDATAFNVSFGVDDGFSEGVRISGLSAGANTTVCVTDPTLRTAGDVVTITVTADCNAEVVESNETNNASTLGITVVNNGYKGKRYTGGNDVTTWKTFELNGNLVYSVGDSQYVSGGNLWTTVNASWTASDLPVPDDASVKEARLFVPYTWDKADVMPDEVNLSFNGISQTLDAHYSDEKMYGSSKPYGMLAYNVTDGFDTSGNVANLTNRHPGGGNVSMRGMLLVVIYADDSEALRMIFVNEEFDLLYGGSSKCTTPEEATAYAPFGAIDTSKVESATLITVAPGAGPNEGELIFNDYNWTDVWNYAGNSQIGIDESDVTLYLNATDNEAGFQSSGDYMEASNAILVISYEEEFFDTGTPANPYPSITGIHKGTIRPSHDIHVSKMYTYPCTGTGGHSKYVAFYNATTGEGEEIANGTWKGYGVGDYHYVEFDVPFVLHENETYNYTIRTGSYPQIHHTEELKIDAGVITCTSFVDANGKRYTGLIPAIRLE